MPCHWPASARGVPLPMAAAAGKGREDVISPPPGERAEGVDASAAQLPSACALASRTGVSPPAHRPWSGESVRAVVAEYEEKLQEAANYVAYQDTELARERENVLSLEKRLRDLEALATSFDGVQKCYAIQAGRELRILVDSENVSDEKASNLSFDISQKIEKEMQYPGQIKVTVIREMRAVNFAK
jgi:hypothetical protein